MCVEFRSPLPADVSEEGVSVATDAYCQVKNSA